MPQRIQINDLTAVVIRNVVSNGKTITRFSFERSDIFNPVTIECCMATTEERPTVKMPPSLKKQLQEQHKAHCPKESQ